jgi:hypothetical protein
MRLRKPLLDHVTYRDLERECCVVVNRLSNEEHGEGLGIRLLVGSKAAPPGEVLLFTHA